MENSIDGENLLNYFLKPIKGVTDMQYDVQKRWKIISKSYMNRSANRQYSYRIPRVLDNVFFRKDSYWVLGTILEHDNWKGFKVKQCDYYRNWEKFYNYFQTKEYDEFYPHDENHTHDIEHQSLVGTQEHEFNLLLEWYFNNIYINTNPDSIELIRLQNWPLYSGKPMYCLVYNVEEEYYEWRECFYIRSTHKKTPLEIKGDGEAAREKMDIITHVAYNKAEVIDEDDRLSFFKRVKTSRYPYVFIQDDSYDTVYQIVSIDTEDYMVELKDISIDDSIKTDIVGMEINTTVHINRLIPAKVNKREITYRKQETEQRNQDFRTQTFNKINRNENKIQELQSDLNYVNESIQQSITHDKSEKPYEQEKSNLELGINKLVREIKELEDSQRAEENYNANMINDLNNLDPSIITDFLVKDMDKFNSLIPIQKIHNHAFEETDFLVNERKCLSVSEDTYNYFTTEYLQKYAVGSIPFKKLVLSRAAHQDILDDDSLEKISYNKRSRLESLKKIRESIDKDEATKKKEIKDRIRKEEEKKKEITLQQLVSLLGTQSNLRQIIYNYLDKEEILYYTIKTKEDEIITKSRINNNINYTNDKTSYIL